MATKKNQVLVPDHVYVPKHEIITKQEAEGILKKYNCKPTELPLIFVNDPCNFGTWCKTWGYDQDYPKKSHCWRKSLLSICGGSLNGRSFNQALASNSGYFKT